MITSTDGAMPEIAGDAAELVDPYDVSSVAVGLERIIADSSRRQELVRLGFERARRFSWEEHARRTIEVFRRFLYGGARA